MDKNAIKGGGFCCSRLHMDESVESLWHADTKDVEDKLKNEMFWVSSKLFRVHNRIPQDLIKHYNKLVECFTAELIKHYNKLVECFTAEFFQFIMQRSL